MSGSSTSITTTMFDLVKSLRADLVSAAVASALASPLVSVIDSAIIMRTATGEPMAACVRSSLNRAGRTPVAFLRSKPLLLMFMVYFGTYTTANISDTAHAATESLPPETISGTSAKFFFTTAVSTGLCVYKDGRFAKMFGAATAKTPVPPESYGLFILRDGITVWACFILPSLLAPWLANLPFANSRCFGALIGSEEASLKTSQLVLPAAVQFVSTPVHLLGLSYYNHQDQLSFLDRLRHVRQNLFVSIPLRILRIVPAYGIGNVVNASIRRSILHTGDHKSNDIL